MSLVAAYNATSIVLAEGRRQTETERVYRKRLRRTWCETQVIETRSERDIVRNVTWNIKHLCSVRCIIDEILQGSAVSWMLTAADLTPVCRRLMSDCPLISEFLNTAVTV